MDNSTTRRWEAEERKNKLKYFEETTAKENKGLLRGTIVKELETINNDGEKVFKTIVRSKQRKERENLIPVIIDEKALKECDLEELVIFRHIKIIGEWRALKTIDKNGKAHLKAFLYATKVKIDTELKDENHLNLIGTIKKAPIYRLSPGGYEITDVVITVKDENGLENVIPCVAWWDNAKMMKDLSVGTRIVLYGKMQSRNYFKFFSKDSNEGENRTAYEISIISFREEEE